MSFSTQTRALTGECGFRLLPTDDFDSAAAAAYVRTVADGLGLVVSYDWNHITDGPHSGMLLVTESESGALQATWLDSFHQKPYPMQLTGAFAGDVIELEGVYAATWGWQISLTIAEDGPIRLVMRNLVPPEFNNGVTSEPYVVMQLAAHTRDTR